LWRVNQPLFGRVSGHCWTRIMVSSGFSYTLTVSMHRALIRPAVLMVDETMHPVVEELKV
jgi:hypothetical protein